MAISFIRLRDFIDSRFCIGYEISMVVSFVLSRDFNDGRFYSVTRFQ